MTNSILAIYKGKLLLSSDDNLFEKEMWCLVGENKKWVGSSSEFAKKIFKNITNLNSLEIEEICLNVKNQQNIFMIKLSDKNVNNMNRKERERLEFYDLNEIFSLNITNPTRLVLESYKDKISSFLLE